MPNIYHTQQCFFWILFPSSAAFTESAHLNLNHFCHVKEAMFIKEQYLINTAGF